MPGHPCSATRPPCRRRPLARRAARLLWAAWAVSAALRAGPAAAAAFLPGPNEADPPTGDKAALAMPEEPLAGSGIRWLLAPPRWRGSLSLDGRWLRLEDGRHTTLGQVLGDLEFASYVWQPWFIQLRGGVGGLVARDASGGGDSPPSQNGTQAATGRVQLIVFPASRFPFELRADVGDSRSSGETLVNDFRTLRVSVSQAYRPPTGNDAYALNFDFSRVRGSDGASDTLGLLQASAVKQWTDQSLDIGLHWSDNTRSDSDDRSRQANLTMRHAWQPQTAFGAETLASWSDLRLRVGGTSAPLRLDTTMLQLSTFATWRPRAGDFGYVENAPLTGAATLRLLENTSGSGGAEQRAKAVNLSAGLAKEFSHAWRVNGAVSVNHLDIGAGTPQTLTALNGSVLFTPENVMWGDWRWAPTASASVGMSDTPEGERRRLAGLQGSHGVSRNWVLGAGHSLSVNLSQSLGVLRESPTDVTSSGWSHGLGLFWQSSGDGTTQSFAGLSLNDSRTRALADGHFQLVNLQVSRRSQLSRHNSWSASLTLQATRSDAELIDPFTGTLRMQSDGWQRFYSGALTFESQRVFGIPRLRFTGLATVNSQQIERRAAGDIDAPLERITESLEARLDYSIGRLDTRLAARLARIDGNTVAALSARAQRRF